MGLVPIDVPIVVSFLSGAALLGAGVVASIQALSAVGAVIMAGAFAVPLLGVGRDLG